MRFLSFILSLAFFQCFSNIPPERLESLQSDSLKVEQLFQAAISVGTSHKNSVEYATEALKLAREAGSLELEAKILHFLGTTHWSHSNYEASRNYLFQAIEVFTKLEDTFHVGQCFNTIGLTYYYQADFSTALQNLSQALGLFHQINDSSQISRVSNNMGLVHNSNGKFDSANIYFIKGLNHKLSYRSIHDQFQIAERQDRIYNSKSITGAFTPQLKAELEFAVSNDDFNQIASVYSRIGGIHFMQARYDSSLHYFKKAGAIYDSLQNRPSYAFELLDIAKCYSALGLEEEASKQYQQTLPLLKQEELNPTIGSWHIYYGKHLSKYDRTTEAVQVFQNGLKHAAKFGHLANVSKFHCLIAQVQLKGRKHQSALKSAEKALEMAEQIGSFDRKKAATEMLYEASLAVGNLREAIGYQKQFHEMAQRLENSKTERASLEFEAKFRYQEQAKEIGELRKDNEVKDLKLSRQLTIIYSAITLVLFSIVFYILLRGRLKKVRLLNKQIANQNVSLKSKNRENELLVKEVHHRVKNNLQIVSNMISLQKRRILDLDTKAILENTQSRIGVIGLIHEQLYKVNDITTVSIKDYIPQLTNLLLQSFYKGEDVEVGYNIQTDNLDLDTSILVGIITHEVILNSIKHAFKDHEAPKLEIEVLRNEDHLELLFRDNGPGVNGKMDGFGWTIIETIVGNASGQLTHKNEDGLIVSISFKI